MKKSILKAYAELIVKSGIALRKGQDVIVQANVDIEDFTAMVVEQCYKSGAKHVIVRWGSEKVNRAKYKKGKEKYLSELLSFDVAYQEYLNKELPALIWLDSDDPDANKGLDLEKVSRVTCALRRAIWPFRVQRDEKYQWTIVGVPSKGWAKKVFPDLPAKKAVEKLWEAVLSTARALDGNGIQNWIDHDKDVKARCAYLNNLKLKSLHYTSKKGTDLTVGLIPGVIFLAAGETDTQGDYFQPNMPSEECFTTPMKGKAEGIVYSAKPLVYNGVVITDFWVKFENGKAVDCHAATGEETLRSIINTDENSMYLGECALVPFDSPINNTGILFYNTLFDENASCHLALGRGFPNLLPGYEKMSQEELVEAGINSSAQHCDFMIGSEDLNIEGITSEGKKVQIFKNGNWAF